MACIPAEILTAYLKNKNVDFTLQQFAAPNVNEMESIVRPVLIYIRANILISRTCLIFSLLRSI
jgi:hypothetical protein